MMSLQQKKYHYLGPLHKERKGMIVSLAYLNGLVENPLKQTDPF